jgi:Kef-type K+ transport system membrane component KefB
MNDVAQAAATASHADLAHLMVQFVLQLAVIMIAARLGGSMFHRWLRLPRVLGELCSGMVIGPYALGGLCLPGFGVMFTPSPTGAAVSPELYALATLASIILLFLAGLETDLGTFLRYSLAGSVVGLGGVVFSFVLGDLCALWFGVADSFMSPTALFMGTIATATSVGITARILSEKRKTSSPEGVTIMAAAVFDDVLGIVLLAIVVGISRAETSGHGTQWAAIGWIAAKAFGFWLVCTIAGLLLAPRISRVLKISRTPATIVSLSLGLALLLAGLAELAGLAMIIGAYIMGLSLSRTDLVHFLQNELEGIYNILVPVFFCVMGMLVDFSAMRGLLMFGACYSLLAVLSKVAGCALPALTSGFNMRGALRIGLGMLPRGEVALIIAGVGLTGGIVGPDVFGVAIMMTVVTTLAAPPLLLKSFTNANGLRDPGKALASTNVVAAAIEFPSTDLAEFMVGRLVRGFRREEFFVQRLHTDSMTYRILKENLAFTLTQEGPSLQLTSPPDQRDIARLMMLEEMLSLQDLLESAGSMGDLQDVQSELARGLFN